jgi:glycosyltransferase involved in cell wall biosynthesis
MTDKAIMVSNDDFQKSPTFLVENKKIMIRNGIGNLEMFDKENARKALLPNFSKECIWIGTVAELHKNKGLDYGVKAIIDIKKTSKEDLEKFIWVIVSDGDEREKLQKMIDENSLGEKIFLNQFPARFRRLTLVKMFIEITSEARIDRFKIIKRYFSSVLVEFVYFEI